MTNMFGYISKDNLTETQKLFRERIITSLAVGSSRWNEDAIGFVTINKKEVEAVKRMISPSKVIYSEEYKKLLRKEHSILIGSSQITSKLERDEVQPIVKGYNDHVVGTFSGYLTNRYSFDEVSKTDAEALIRGLWFDNNDYRKFFEKVDGSGELIWWSDRTPDKIYIKENSAVYFSSVKELKTTFYSSLRHSLEAALVAVFDKKYLVSATEKDHIYKITQRRQITKEKLSVKKYKFSNYGDNYRDEEDFQSYDPEQEKEIVEMDKGILLGCLKCKKPIIEEGSFYWNQIKKQVRCVSCGEKSRPKLDWVKFSEEEYIEMVEKTNWNFAL